MISINLNARVASFEDWDEAIGSLDVLRLLPRFCAKETHSQRCQELRRHSRAPDHLSRALNKAALLASENFLKVVTSRP